MIRKLGMLILCLAAASITVRAAAQDGWYLRTNLGFTVAPGLTLDARDNDWGTKCDKLSNPGLAETGADDCLTAPPPAQWTHEVGRGNGVQSVLALGYSWNDLRFEGEYLYRTTSYKPGEGESQIIDVVTQEKQQQELETLAGGLEDLMAHGFFANAYYDFQSDSPFTPYLGIGVGIAHTSLDYYGRFKRNDDPDAISTFEDPSVEGPARRDHDRGQAQDERSADRLPGCGWSGLRAQRQGGYRRQVSLVEVQRVRRRKTLDPASKPRVIGGPGIRRHVRHLDQRSHDDRGQFEHEVQLLIWPA